MVSAECFSYGYFGSVLLLIVSLGSIMGYNLIGLPDKGIATKISFGLVGIWWIGFAQITFYYLPTEKHRRVPVSSLLKNGYNEILKVWKSLKGMASTKFFLGAFFFYNTGVQTVIYLATIFGSKELNLPTEDLILAVLIIQVVAIGGSYLFAKISTKKGNKFSLVIMISIWITVCLYAYFLHTATQFYVLAVIVGMVMGGIQALSRATYSKLIPQNTISPTSYFSFYDVLEKVSIFMGTFAYGLIEHITGSMRNSTLALAFFFIAGMIFLIFVVIPKPSEIKSSRI
jgi:UMF1 family MFS transporter